MIPRNSFDPFLARVRGALLAGDGERVLEEAARRCSPEQFVIVLDELRAVRASRNDLHHGDTETRSRTFGGPQRV